MSVASPDLRTPENNRRIEFPGLEVNLSQEKNGEKYIDCVSFRGRIDSQNSYKLNRQAHNDFFKWDKDILIEMKELEYINSVGIAVLFSIFHRQRESKKRVAIGSMHPFLNQIFDLVHIPPEVLLFDSTEEARRALL